MDARDVEVREFYNNYTPPAHVRKTVQKLLDSIPDKFVQGLECVVLTNQSGHPRRDRLGTVTSRKRRLKKSGTLGRYHHKHQGKRPWVELYVDNMVLNLDTAPLKWTSFMRYMGFGATLFHEIGHHVHFTMKPAFREPEDVADDWRSRFLIHFLRKHYWYLGRKPLRWILRAFSEYLQQQAG